MIYHISGLKVYLYQIFIFSILLLLCSSCSQNKEKIRPQKRNLSESVYASVVIQPDSIYKVYAAVAGILDKNLVEEGDHVSRGDALIQIVNNTPKLNNRNAKLSLDLAKENYKGNAAVLSGIEEEIAAANLKFKNDSINYDRQKNLWNQKIGSKVEFDTRKLNYELSQNNLVLLNSKYNRTKNELQTAVKQAQNNYQTSLINTKDFTVTSRINGKVYALYKNHGEIINAMEPLASVGSATVFIIEMLVDEVDIVSVAIDQEVLVTLDAYNGKVFRGNVTKILPKKDERNQTFKVEALFDLAPQVLYPGLSGEANIIIAKKDSVLTIPKEYLMDENMVKTKVGLTKVTTGLENLEYVEILSGIHDQTFIYKPE